MQMENLEFVDALRLLADKAGIKLAPRRKIPGFEKQESIKTKIFQINVLAALAWHKILTEKPIAKIAREYLAKRGLKDRTIAEFELGYAPRQPFLGEFLSRHGFTTSQLQAAGNPEKFSDRIIFPISNILGKIIAFTGRALDNERLPKYLNTPETQIFQKSRILYGLDKARQNIRTCKQVILVEGQMDVIFCHQAGIKNVVASSGTALTLDQIEILSRYNAEILFAFDNDSAGIEAAKKGAAMAISFGLDVKMVSYHGKDPGEAVMSNLQDFKLAITKAKPIVDWYFSQTFKDLPKDLTVAEKKKAAQQLLPIIKKLPDDIEQAHYVQLLAKKLTVAEKTIEQAMAKVKVRGETSSKPVKSPQYQPKTEELLLGLMLAWPELTKYITSKIDLKDIAHDPDLIAIAKTCYNKTKLPSELRKKVDLLIFQAETNFEDDLPEERQKASQELIDSILSHKNRAKQEDYLVKIQQAEASGDRSQVKKLIKEFQNAVIDSKKAN